MSKLSFESVKKHFEQWNREQDVIEFETSSATVDQAAETIGVIPARIAKTLSFRGSEEQAILIVAAGDAKLIIRNFATSLVIKLVCCRQMRCLSKQAMRLEGFVHLV